MDNNQQDPPEINEIYRRYASSITSGAMGWFFSPLLSLLHYAVYFHLAS